MTTKSVTRISEARLKSFIESAFAGMGLSSGDAELAADVLVEADLRGFHSHGALRLPVYCELIQAKRINPHPHIDFANRHKAVAVVNGDDGLGLVVAPRAMEVAIENARSFGIGCVAVKQSNHYGIASYTALMAVEQQMIGISMTNNSACVSPTFGVDRMLGTNPIAIAVPTKTDFPFVSDFSTSVKSYGKLQIAQEEGEQIPLGWAQNQTGESVTNPFVVDEGGTLLPLGSDDEHSSYKGYGLAASVDILSGVLSGAAFLKYVPYFVAIKSHLNTANETISSRGSGHFLMAIDIAAFRDLDNFYEDMRLFIETLQNCTSAAFDERVLIHGETEHALRQQYKKNGIPLYESTVERLNAMAKALDIEGLAV